jgi:hypothetical protein
MHRSGWRFCRKVIKYAQILLTSFVFFYIHLRFIVGRVYYFRYDSMRWGFHGSEDEGSKVLRSFGILPQHYMASQPRRLRYGYLYWLLYIFIINKRTYDQWGIHVHKGNVFKICELQQKFTFLVLLANFLFQDLLEQFTAICMVNTFSLYMQFESSWPCSQNSAIRHYSDSV